VGSPSCPSASLCAGPGIPGQVDVITDVSGPRPQLATIQLIAPPSKPYFLTVELTVVCPRVSVCVTLATDGRVFSSTTPARGRAAWGVASPDSGATLSNTIACPTASRCLAVDDRGQLITGRSGATGGLRALRARA
jgi:hypothetical protein